jgi:hypothetical protein
VTNQLVTSLYPVPVVLRTSATRARAISSLVLGGCLLALPVIAVLNRPGENCRPCRDSRSIEHVVFL